MNLQYSLFDDHTIMRICNVQTLQKKNQVIFFLKKKKNYGERKIVQYSCIPLNAIGFLVKTLQRKPLWEKTLAKKKSTIYTNPLIIDSPS
jgi:uncharacterized protein YerC